MLRLKLEENYQKILQKRIATHIHIQCSKKGTNLLVTEIMQMQRMFNIESNELETCVEFVEEQRQTRNDESGERR